MTTAPNDDDALVSFAEDAPPLTEELPSARAWKVLVVDDDREVHDITRLALHGQSVDGHAIVMISVYSAEAARAVLQAHSDVGMVLLDVVMESEDAGLELARWIRQDLGNARVRVVLRTGQPGLAPEQRVMSDYDIHDYRDKTELTARRLATTVLGALRSYRDLCTIEGQKAGLERLLRASATLHERQSFEVFITAVLRQLSALVSPQDSAMFFQGRDLGHADAPAVVAGTGRFESVVGRPVIEVVDEDIWRDITLLLASRQSVRRSHYSLFGIFRDSQLWAAVLLEGLGELGPWEQRLVELFCHNASIALDNHRLQNRQNALMDAFSRFVPRRLLELLGRPDATEAGLGDHIQREMTVMFVDQRSFTARAEQLDPNETFSRLNGFFAAIVPAIHAHGGVVDKYLGDGLMAVFPDSPAHAVRAALEIRGRAHELGVGVGIGIHAGPVTLGLVGADGRIESTVVADSVNIASRVERLTRRFDVDVLVTADVHSRLPPELLRDSRPLGALFVKGKQRPVAIHELFSADPEVVRADKQASLEPLTAAVALLRAGLAAEAEQRLIALAVEHPRDPALPALVDECRRLQRM